MDVFERKKDALWIPYQLGAEFQRLRLDVQQQALDAYDRLTEGLTSFANQAKNNLNQYRAHPVIEIDRELSALELYLSDFELRMAEAKIKHPTDEFAASFEKVTALFAGRVGAKAHSRAYCRDTKGRRGALREKDSARIRGHEKRRGGR
jgi:hypothetical protein